MFVKIGGHMVVAQAVVVAAVAHFACTLKVHTHTEALFTTVWGRKKSRHPIGGILVLVDAIRVRERSGNTPWF